MSNENIAPQPKAEKPVEAKRRPGRPKKTEQAKNSTESKRRPGRPKGVKAAKPVYEIPTVPEDVEVKEDLGDREFLRTLVTSAYHIQKLRIQLGNRIVASFKNKLGILPGQKEDDNEEISKFLTPLREEYKLMSEALISVSRYKDSMFSNGTYITTKTEFLFVRSFENLYDQEGKNFKLVESEVIKFPIWKTFLKDVYGCGPAMSGVIISYIDITKDKYRSCLEAYVGIDVAPDGKGRSKIAAHLVERPYLDKDGNEKTKMSITFSPFLKTKLLGVLFGGFLMCGEKSKYSKVYYQNKNTLVERFKNDESMTKIHLHYMARRKAVKAFLHDLYEAWRPLEGLKVYPSFYEERIKGEPHREGSVNKDFPFNTMTDSAGNPYLT